MIGIFDSGIGGLTVAREIMALLPGYDIIYFGDTARTPYGNKNPETIRAYALQDARFLIENGAEILVVACNTASSVATDLIRKDIPVPVFEVISPAVEEAVRNTRSGRIGVIGTRTTIESGIYEHRIQKLSPETRVWSRACPLLVPIVEEGWEKKPETRMIIKKYLNPIKIRQVDTLILGCTHFPILKDIIQRKIGKRVNVIDSSAPVAAQISQYLSNETHVDARMKKEGMIQCYVSSVTNHFKVIARRMLNRNVAIRQADVF